MRVRLHAHLKLPEEWLPSLVAGCGKLDSKRAYQLPDWGGKGTVIAFGTYPLVVRCSLFLAHANLHA